MQRYLRTRYKTYASVVFGFVIGFIVVTFLYDQPDYKSAIIAVLIGLIVGELFAFSRWSKTEREKKNI